MKNETSISTKKHLYQVPRNQSKHLTHYEVGNEHKKQETSS